MLRKNTLFSKIFFAGLLYNSGLNCVSASSNLDVYGYYQETAKLESNTAVTVGKNGWLFYSEDKLDSTSDLALNAIVNTAHAIERTGVKVIISMVPIKSRIYPEFLPDEIKLTDKSNSRYTDYLKYMISNKLTAVDISGTLIRARLFDNKTLVFHSNDTHWTPFGARIAAGAIASAIRLNSNISNVKKTLYTRKTTIGENYGDLFVFFPQEVKDKYLHSVKFMNYVYDAVDSKRIGLLDEDAPQIALVGSSYSEEPRGFRQAISFSIERDIIDASIGGGGIWIPMEKYLSSATYKDNKPKVLIWEFPEYRLWLDPPKNWLEEKILPFLK